MSRRLTSRDPDPAPGTEVEAFDPNGYYPSIPCTVVRVKPANNGGRYIEATTDDGRELVGPLTLFRIV